jgi:hypothetical protein
MPQEKEKREVFRKSTLERISSPEKLNEYIRVSRPSVWIILGAIAVILAAAVFWGVTAEITPDGLRPIDFLLG